MHGNTTFATGVWGMWSTQGNPDRWQHHGSPKPSQQTVPEQVVLPLGPAKLSVLAQLRATTWSYLTGQRGGDGNGNGLCFFLMAMPWYLLKLCGEESKQQWNKSGKTSLKSQGRDTTNTDHHQHHSSRGRALLSLLMQQIETHMHIQIKHWNGAPL